MNDIRDQADLIAEIETIEGEIDRLEMSMTAHGKTIPPRPTLPKDDLLHAIELLGGHRSVLTTSVSLARTQQLSQVASFTGKPASDTATSAPANPSPPATMTATEKVLAARGVATLADLKKVSGTRSDRRTPRAVATGGEASSPSHNATSVDAQLVHAVSVVMKKLQPEQTATDRVLAAEGCKTVEELTTKRAKQRNEKYTKR